MENNKEYTCVDCGVYNCLSKTATYPQFCLTTKLTKEEEEDVLALLQEPDNNKIAVASAEVEYEGYMKLTRVEEVVAFAKKIGAKKLGIATCAGMIKESKILTKVLEVHGFEVYGALCKVGAMDKTMIGIPKECEAVGATMCNPILQAKVLNKAKTDFNLVMGLCVGHDSLFYKYSDALCTTVVTKDRVLGHNPVAALYGADFYYKRLMQGDK